MIQIKFQTNCLSKHLCLILDSQQTFDEHLKTIFSKVNKTMGLIRKMKNSLPRPSLMALYKSFIRPHLYYGDIIYDQPFNNSFQNKIESVQYNACLAVTGAIRGASKERLYEKLGLESLQHHCCIGNFVIFTKLYSTILQTIYSKLFPLVILFITLGILMTFF